MQRQKRLWKDYFGDMLRRLFGDTRPQEVRDAPFGCLEMTLSGNRCRREVEALREMSKLREIELPKPVISRHRDILPCPQVYIPEQPVEPCRNARKPHYTRREVVFPNHFDKLFELGVFDLATSLAGIDPCWAFQVLYDKHEIRAWRFPIISSTPSLIITQEGLTAKDSDEITLQEIDVLWTRLFNHLREQQNLNDKEKQ